MRERRVGAVEAVDRTQHQGSSERARTTLSCWRRLAVLTATLVLVAGVHPARVLEALAVEPPVLQARAEHRVSLGDVGASLLFEQSGSHYRVTLSFDEQAPAEKVQVAFLQVAVDFANGDLASNLAMTWSDNVTLGDGCLLFTPTYNGDVAVFEFDDLPLASISTYEIELETSAKAYLQLRARMTDLLDTAHYLLSREMWIVEGRSSRRHTLATFLPQRETQQPEGLVTLNDLRIRYQAGDLEPVRIHRLAFWSPPEDVLPDAEGTYTFWVPIAPGVVFQIVAGSHAATVSLDGIVGTITASNMPPNPWEDVRLVNQDGDETIYDDQPIHLSLPEGLTAQDIGKVEWYRNGIRLRFVGEDELGLTNDQMKTFDGNPAEHSPASAHSDHAIMGYEYSARIYDVEGRLQVMRQTEIRSRMTWRPQFVYANFFSHWAKFIDDFTDRQILDWLARLKQGGISGGSVDVIYFMRTPHDNDILPHYAIDEENVHEWGLVTPTEGQLRRFLGLINEVGLEIEVRVQIYVSYEWRRNNPFYFSGNIAPRNMSLFFQNYATRMETLARVIRDYDVNLFTPFTEMNSLEQYPTLIKSVFDRIDRVFNGQMAFEQSTHAYLFGFNAYDEETRFEVNVGRHWDWTDSKGRPLVISSSGWTTLMETQNDQRFSHMLQEFVRFWRPAQTYFRTNYPSSTWIFGEIGTFACDGVSRGMDYYYGPENRYVLDMQEYNDATAAQLLGSRQLGLDGVVIWVYSAFDQVLDPRETLPNCRAAEILTGSVQYNLIRSIIAPQE